MLTDWTLIESELPGRICFLVRGLDGGGAQRDAILLANTLQSSGRPTAIVTLDARGPLLDLIDKQVPVVDLGRGRKLRLALAFNALRKLMARGRPRIVVASEAGANVLTTLAARSLLGRRPHLVLREVASPVQASRNDPYWQNRLAYRLVRLIYPLADLVLTFTAGAKHDLETAFRLPAGKVVNFGTNAVLTPAMQHRIAQTVPARESGRIVSVGRLSSEKGFATLIDAFALVRRERAVGLTIVGNGSERAHLDALVASHHLGDDVTFTGHLADPLPVLRSADLYVCSSLHEGLGNSIIEALACGVPVVSTDAPHGPREILKDGSLGTLVPVGDATALARAMSATLDAPRDSEAYEHRAADFTVAAAALRFAELIDDLPPGSQPSGTTTNEAARSHHFTTA